MGRQQEDRLRDMQQISVIKGRMKHDRNQISERPAVGREKIEVQQFGHSGEQVVLNWRRQPRTDEGPKAEALSRTAGPGLDCMGAGRSARCKWDEAEWGNSYM